MISKIAVFGGTGRTGQHLIRQALESGFLVAALARSPEKLAAAQDSKPDGLVLVKGAVTDSAAVNLVLQGADAVISLLGPSDNRPTFEICRGMQVILDGMFTQGIRRILLTAGAGVSTPGDSPTAFDHLIGLMLKATARNVYQDMQLSVDLVRASGLDWTVVRAPMLTDQQGGGQIRVGMLGEGVGMRLARSDLAAFILKQVASSEYLCRSPVISN